VLEYDHLIVYGPVFPHEVAGFSGGNKYFFPGVAGPEVLNFFHWLGAVITNMGIIGRKNTPVRRVINKSASFIKKPCLFLCSVIKDGQVKGLFTGSHGEAWPKAANLSSKLHMVYLRRQYRQVLGIAPKMYDDIWTAGKVMYKLEPIVADGGELIIYAPHITEVSYTHGKTLDKIGYHVRDYFLMQKNRFKGVSRSVMAHSTHVRGVGTFDNGIEKPRIKVTLATAIPPERCHKINLGYKNPAHIILSEWRNGEDKDKLVVDHAGEILHRLK
jgi:nickel-dependent lactate racemase